MSHSPWKSGDILKKKGGDTAENWQDRDFKLVWRQKQLKFSCVHKYQQR